MAHSKKFSLPDLTRYKKLKMMAAAQQILEAQQEIQQNYGGLQHFMLAHHLSEKPTRGEKFFRNVHYPAGDRIDYTNGSQYFYHCHREDEDRGEHGHFHTFIRGKFFPKSYKRAQIPNPDKYDDRPMTHLVAVALNRSGQLCRLFTVNRWVSKEAWFDAPLAQKFALKFDPTHIEVNLEWAAMDRWIAGVMTLYMPQVHWLLTERDRSIAAFRKQAGIQDPYEDQSPAFEELSSLDVSLESQVAWLMEN